MSAGDFCTTSDIETFLSLNAGQDTALLASLITGASAFINNYCSRNLLAADYVENRHGHGNNSLCTKQWPINSVSSVKIDGQTIPQSLDPTKDGWVFSEHTVYLRGCYSFCPGILNVTISYNGGYATLPADLKQACIEIVAAKYKRRTDLHLSSKVLEQQQVTFSQSDIPPSVKPVLNQYSRVF